MSAATANMVNEKNKMTFFEALKKTAHDSGQAAKAAAMATGRGIKKAAKAVVDATATGLAWLGNGITFLGRVFAQTTKAAISMAAVGADLTVSVVGFAAMHAVHVAYKTVYGLGLLLTLPAIAGAYGTLGVSRAWDAYKGMWTRAGWKYYTAMSYYSVLNAERGAREPDSDWLAPVHDINSKRVS